MFSYQCSQLSTSESIKDIFRSAQKFQSGQDIKQYVSVVVLDEVGLAEASPSLPLKVLHPLLEDGTEGSGEDHQQKVRNSFYFKFMHSLTVQSVEPEKRVAFIGISNWALDPAKMNRGVMVTRGEPELEELLFSARGICSTKDNDPVREKLQCYLEPLSRAYLEICKKQRRSYFGLRDFYRQEKNFCMYLPAMQSLLHILYNSSLIKMLYWMCNQSKGVLPLSGAQLEHAIRRNFGGLEDDSVNPYDEVHKAVGHLENKQDLSKGEDKVC